METSEEIDLEILIHGTPQCEWPAEGHVGPCLHTAVIVFMFSCGKHHSMLACADIRQQYNNMMSVSGVYPALGSIMVCNFCHRPATECWKVIPL